MTRRTSLSDRMLTQFVVCIALLLLLATPLFYLLTKHYYAEDMIDVIEAVKQGLPIPDIDLKEDIMQGIMIQFAIIVGVLGIAIVLTLRFISRRLWRPFDETLRQIEAFRLEKGVLPVLPESDVAEFPPEPDADNPDGQQPEELPHAERVHRKRLTRIADTARRVPKPARPAPPVA